MQRAHPQKEISPHPQYALHLNCIALAIIIVGCLQMVGFLLENRTLRGLGAASSISPLPKVFSAVNQYETYAAEFTIFYELAGNTVAQIITPAFYQQLRGPYNRRNVYGAALAYAPVLPEKIWKTVFRYGLKNDGPFITELGIPENAEHIRIRVRSKTTGSKAQWIFAPGRTE